MHDLRLFREHKSDATELKDEMQTLEEAGIGGAPKDADELVSCGGHVCVCLCLSEEW